MAEKSQVHLLSATSILKCHWQTFDMCSVPQDWVVSSLVLKYKLVRGKYEREHNRLDVQEMSR
jgi:hypothetical protein